MTNAAFALRVALIARISAQYSHELVYGMGNPEFCADDAGFPVQRFVEDIDRHLAVLRADREQGVPDGS